MGQYVGPQKAPHTYIADIREYPHTPGTLNFVSLEFVVELRFSGNKIHCFPRDQPLSVHYSRASNGVDALENATYISERVRLLIQRK